MSTSQEVAVIPVTLAVMDAMEEQAPSVLIVTLQTTLKTIQETVYASLDITETGQCVLNVTTHAKNAQEEAAANAQPAVLPLF